MEGAKREFSRRTDRIEELVSRMPTIAARLHIANKPEQEQIQSILLNCQLQLQPLGRQYTALDTASIAVTAMLSGTVFYSGEAGGMQIHQIPWDREARFQLPVEAWKAAIDAHYPETAWLRLPRDTFDRLYRFKVARSMPFWQNAIDRLLDQAEQDELAATLTAGGGQ